MASPIVFVTEVRHAAYAIAVGANTAALTPPLGDVVPGSASVMGTTRSTNAGYSNNRVRVRVGSQPYRAGTAGIVTGAVHAVLWRVGPT